MAEKVQEDSGSDTTDVVGYSTGETKRIRCKRCRMEWEVGGPAHHRPGCKNAEREK